jgi:hypothetical protein
MTETIFYIKKGRKYIPHSTYSSEFCDSFPKGTHLVDVYPGGSSRRFNIDPAYAPMIAAARVAEDAISKSIMDASALRVPERDKPLTPAQLKAWKALAKAFGREQYALEWCSYREAAEAGAKAMQVEADKLLTNPIVRKAYERFLFVAELTKDHASNKADN